MPPDTLAHPAGAVAADDLAVVVATRSEAKAIQRHARDLRVEVVGMGLHGNPRIDFAKFPVVISAGLCGGLQAAQQPGDVVIATGAAGADGLVMPCDTERSDELAAAATRAGFNVIRGQMVTLDHMVTGDERAAWAKRGFIAADMESALLAHRAKAFAVLRVVLDTPARELSPLWTHPLRAALHPRLWGQALWLIRHARGYAAAPGRILARLTE